MGAMFWLGVCSLILTLGIVVGHAIFGSGRQTQGVSDNRRYVERTLEDHSTAINRLRDTQYQHDKQDQEHFSDNTRHFTPQERPWMTQQFVAVDKQFEKVWERFDKTDERFDKLERLIRREES